MFTVKSDGSFLSHIFFRKKKLTFSENLYQLEKNSFKGYIQTYKTSTLVRICSGFICLMVYLSSLDL